MVDKNAVEDFLKAIQPQEENKDHTYNATVTRVDENNTVWVQVAGSDKETPTSSTSSEVKRGDTVNVQWRNNKLYVAGNYSNPAAGSVRVSAVEQAAQVANQAASNAVADAGVAREAAEDAKATADSVHGIAVQAQEDAAAAQRSAETANDAASSALNGLSLVENVVGVLNWVSTHATYQLTSDDSIVQGKWYFTYDAVNNRYEVVNNPTGDPSALGYYEIVSIDEAVQDYLTSHLALTNNGLWLQTDGVNSKLLLSNTDGLVIYGDSGPLAKYGTDAVIGDENGFHIKIDGTEIGFYQAAQKVAYINGNKLYITQSVVLQQMDVGTPVADGGKGQWSWKVHEVNGQNNLYLKWLG